MPKRAVIVFAKGFEEIEAVTPADILRRAGVSVELVGLDGMEVTGAHGITLKMDRLLKEREDVDAVILPGGMPGTDNLAASSKLVAVLKEQLAAGRIVAAICAAPGLVLGRHGLLDGRRATCFPGCQMHFGRHATYVEASVVSDGNVITSRGAGTAFDFGLTLVRHLAGDGVAGQLADRMVYAH